MSFFSNLFGKKDKNEKPASVAAKPAQAPKIQPSAPAKTNPTPTPPAGSGASGGEAASPQAGSLAEKFAKKKTTNPIDNVKKPDGIKSILDKGTAGTGEGEQNLAQKFNKGTDENKRQSILKERGNVYLVRGKDQGREAWHYVFVWKTKDREFNGHKAGGTLKLTDYGIIISSGWGKDPPADVTAKIDSGDFVIPEDNIPVA